MTFNFTPDQYGEQYGEHLMEMYKLYVEMTDRISQRRMNTNSFFLSANTLLAGFISFFDGVDNKKLLCIVSAGIGIILCGVWFFLLQNYRRLNSGKFKVIYKLETNLPISLYELEWNELGKGKNLKLYWPLSHLEVILPIIFAVIYIILLICLAY